MSLDRSRPFTTVYGIAEHRFSQDGKLFDDDGEELAAPSKASAKKQSKPETPADDQVSTQLED